MPTAKTVAAAVMNADGPPPLKRHKPQMYSNGDSMNGSTNITVQEHSTGREERGAIIGRHGGFRGCTIWFTGLSGAGKTTVSFELEKKLTEMGIPSYGLDGDNVRSGLCKNLSFSKEDRSENIRRVAEVAKLFADAGLVCLASFISPFICDRALARRIHEEGDLKFIEVHVSTSLEVCEQRDPKKLYKKARAGEIPGFTGIDSAYEPPENAEIVLDAGKDSLEKCVTEVISFLQKQGVIPEPEETPLRSLTVEDEAECQRLREEARDLPTVDLKTIDLQWLQVLGEGWASPLSGFMRERQYLQSLHFGQLLDLKHKTMFPGEKEDSTEDEWQLNSAINQSVPIVLPIDGDQKKSLTNEDGSVASRIALRFDNRVVALLEQGEIFEHRKEERVCRQFGYNSAEHPGIAIVLSSGDWCLGGDVKVLERIQYNDGLDQYRKTPAELRKIFKEKNADAVFAFQLRNPIHNGHALLMRDTREKLLKEHRNPILLLHPLGGWTKDDDVPLPVRIKQHEAVMAEGILNPDWTVVAIFPSPMMYAGPTEVQWHARARVAAGANTYIVGRDPAGIGRPGTNELLYNDSHGAKVLSMAPGLTQLRIMPFRVAAFDRRAGKMSFFDASRKEDFEFISGTKMRGLARSGQNPPDGFMAPTAWKVLADYYKSLL